MDAVRQRGCSACARSVGWYLEAMGPMIQEQAIPLVPDSTRLRFALVPRPGWEDQLIDFHDHLLVRALGIGAKERHSKGEGGGGERETLVVCSCEGAVLWPH